VTQVGDELGAQPRDLERGLAFLRQRRPRQTRLDQPAPQPPGLVLLLEHEEAEDDHQPAEPDGQRAVDGSDR